MNTVAIATSIVGMLAPYLLKAGEKIAEKAGDSMWEKMEDIFQNISKKFKDDDDKEAIQALENFQESPNQLKQQKSLIAHLVRKSDQDSDFANYLNNMIEKEENNNRISNISNNIEGDVKNVVSIEHSENTTFQ